MRDLQIGEMPLDMPLTLPSYSGGEFGSFRKVIDHGPGGVSGQERLYPPTRQARGAWDWCTATMLSYEAFVSR